MTFKENLANSCIFEAFPITWGLALQEYRERLRGEYPIDGDERTIIGISAISVDIATHAGSVALILNGKIIEGVALEVAHNIAGMLPRLPDALRAIRRRFNPSAGNGAAIL